MKLLRYGETGLEMPGLLDTDGNIRSLADHITDIDGSVITPEGLESLRELDWTMLPLVESDVRLGACVSNVGKFLCIGLNFEDHARESNMPVPDEPIVFSKFTTAISGPNDAILKPRGSTKLDWEVELAVVVGREIRYAGIEESEQAIAGYCVCNDVSEREFQLERSGQWDIGKGCDTFGPLGPHLVTKDEIADVLNLAMWLEVNGRRYQDGSTRTMIFKPAFIVSFLSQYMTLMPGDIVSTGTPPGVGLGQQPPTFLEVDDVVTLGIEGLGEQRQVVCAA